MKIICTIPVWKRKELTSICLEHLHKKGIDVYIAGSEGEESKSLTEKYSVKYVECKNKPISDKHNILCESIKDVDFDYCLHLGSDDFISSNFIENVTEYLTENPVDLLTFNDIYFYSTKNDKLTHYKGFTGAGRLVSKDLLERCNFNPWLKGRNKGLDTVFMGNVKRHNANIKTLNMDDLGVWVMDVKHSDSISSHSIVNAGIEVDKDVFDFDFSIFENLEGYNCNYIKKGKMKKKGRKKAIVKALKETAGLKIGYKYPVSHSTAASLIKRGIVELVEGDVSAKSNPDKKDSELKLTELRDKYPNITANSKAKFLEKLEEQSKDKGCEGCDDDNPCSDCDEAAKKDAEREAAKKDK